MADQQTKKHVCKLTKPKISNEGAVDLRLGLDGDTMVAAHYDKHGDIARHTKVGRIPKPPRPARGQLLLRVLAAALNPVDYKSGEGEFKMIFKFQWPRVHGFDFCGEVVAVGKQEPITDTTKAAAADAGAATAATTSAAPSASSSSSADENSGSKEAFQVGERVFGQILAMPQFNTGTVAEYVLVDAIACARCPVSVSDIHCAAVPLTASTAFRCLKKCFEHVKGPRRRVLITAGAGGVGIMAIQMAKQIFGATFVATTASKGRKADLCLSLGADHVVDYRTQDFETVLREVKDKDGDFRFDAIVDCTGESKKCVSLLAPNGGLASILAGPTIDGLKSMLEESGIGRNSAAPTFRPGVRLLLYSKLGGKIFQWGSGGSKMLKLCAGVGGHFAHVVATGSGEIMRQVATLMGEGRLRAVIDSTFDLEHAVDAILKQKSGRCAGKVVVRIATTDTESQSSVTAAAVGTTTNAAAAAADTVESKSSAAAASENTKPEPSADTTAESSAAPAAASSVEEPDL